MVFVKNFGGKKSKIIFLVTSFPAGASRKKIWIDKSAEKIVCQAVAVKFVLTISLRVVWIEPRR